MHLMGILNVTPDSFSDGGKWVTVDNAIARGAELIDAGATIIDVGGESTRPGAVEISAETEWERIGEVVRNLAAEVTVSVDTYHADTARKAVEAGAKIINDVRGGLADPQMFATIAELECDYILQHSRGNAQTMNSLSEYAYGVVDTVAQELAQRLDMAVKMGINPQHIILDPGVGFAKLGDQDWELLAGINKFLALGQRVLIGQSRKRFLAAVCGEQSLATQRDTATATISALLSGTEVWAVRVHDVASSAQAIGVREKLLGLGAPYVS